MIVIYESHILFESKTWTCLHKGDLIIHATIVSALVPCGITGSTCRKSPPKIITLPPNRSSTPVMSLNVRYKASNAYRLVIGASSHMITIVRRINSAKSDCLLIEQIDVGSGFSGILNLECVVLPPGMRVVAIPNVVVVSAMHHLLRNDANSDRYKYVLPIPLGPSKKNTLLSPRSITPLISLKAKDR